jgi:hypothetical protein
MFLICSWRYTRPMTREDLLRLIARAVRRSFTFASESQALGAADTVLRDLKAAGIRMLAPRWQADRPPNRRQGSADGADRARELIDQDDQPDRPGNSDGGYEER